MGPPTTATTTSRAIASRDLQFRYARGLSGEHFPERDWSSYNLVGKAEYERIYNGGGKGHSQLYVHYCKKGDDGKKVIFTLLVHMSPPLPTPAVPSPTGSCKYSCALGYRAHAIVIRFTIRNHALNKRTICPNDRPYCQVDAKAP